MTQSFLALHGLEPNGERGAEHAYRLADVRRLAWDWDSVVKATHSSNCGYNIGCSLNVFVKDGVVVREEVAPSFPSQKDPDIPDWNPRICQKGACYSHRMYDPCRLKYPLKRVGPRGAGQWQRVSWETALAEIADTIVEVLTTEGNEGVLAMRGSEAIDSNNLSSVALVGALGLPISNCNLDYGDEHPGASLTWGKNIVCDSADNWSYADTIYVWGLNPAYTYITVFHFLTEARYHGSRIVVISPDYSPSAPFADQWVPVAVGSDAALALAMAQVIIEKGLYQADFVREQTDLPLLVRTDNGKLLTQKDMVRGGRDNIFYMFDQSSRRVVEAPWKGLALGGIVPVLEGEFEVSTLSGRAKVRPVFSLLKAKLDHEYTLEQASRICGVSPETISQLATDFARSKGVVNISSFMWGKFYHGDLIQRAQILLWALCGHFGRKGAGYNAFPILYPDSGFGNLMRAGTDIFSTAQANDPRFAQWREQAYTDEMIWHEYLVDARTSIFNMELFYYHHAGLKEFSAKNDGCDPYLKRPLDDYVKEALGKDWQPAIPGPQKEPRIVIERGGSFLRVSRHTDQIVNNLLPKLKLLVTLDVRMGSTALYSDYVLPVAGMYEKHSFTGAAPMCPYLSLNVKAVQPTGESKTDWEIGCLLARAIEQRARARGTPTFTDRRGQERRLDNLYHQVTAAGMYTEDDEEAATRDFYLNAVNVEKVEWDEFKDRGTVAFTKIPAFHPEFACDISPGEPIVPFTRHVRDKQPYPTLTRRQQFYIDHDWFLELGEALPTHKDNPLMGGSYPLQVTGGHARWSIHSLWKDNPLLLRLQRGVPVMFMSAQDARARGIKDDDRVEVSNDVARFETLAAVSPAVRPGQVIIYHDWENFQFEGKHHFKSVMPSPINPIELVGGHGHVRARGNLYYGCTPGASDRGTRVEVRLPSPSGRGRGLP